MHPLVQKYIYIFKPIREIAKKLLKNRTIRQKFYTGYICFNAIDYAAFWVKDASCEKTDRDIQDRLLKLSLNKEIFVDIGANIGIMSLSVALRNKAIQVISYDPNPYILEYLNQSIQKSKLSDRVKTIPAAVSDAAGKAFMDFSGHPYAAHLANEGTEVQVLDFEKILSDLSDKNVLFKLDIEGIEKLLAPVIVKMKNPKHTFVIELHPLGLNNIADPEFVLNTLYENDFIVCDLSGKILHRDDKVTDWDNIICYSA